MSLKRAFSDVSSRREHCLGRFSCSLQASGIGPPWVHVAGELDLCSAPRLELTLRQASWWLLVILDLRDLSFIDSSGVHVIVDASTRALAADRRLIVTRGPAQVDRMLTLCGAADVLRVVDLDRPTPPEPAGPPLVDLDRPTPPEPAAPPPAAA